MDEEKIKAYFQRQVHAIIERSGDEPDGFRAYFAAREPRDEEVLGLLTISATLNSEFPYDDCFPTLAEALAALSPAARSDICREFREEFRNSVDHLAAV